MGIPRRLLIPSGKAALKTYSKKNLIIWVFSHQTTKWHLGLHAALENNMRIPGDFGIVGYDNMPFSKVFTLNFQQLILI